MPPPPDICYEFYKSQVIFKSDQPGEFHAGTDTMLNSKHEPCFDVNGEIQWYAELDYNIDGISGTLDTKTVYVQRTTDSSKRVLVNFVNRFQNFRVLGIDWNESIYSSRERRT